MATPRKRWFKVADAILREPWPRDVKTTMVMLAAWLNQRWARDNLTPDEACRATLSRAALSEITGRAQLVHSRCALRALGVHVSLAIREQGEFTEIHWPKFAEFQDLPSRGGAKVGQRTARESPSPTPTPTPTLSKRERTDAGASGDAPHDPPQDHSRWLNLLTPSRGEKATDAFQRERTVWLEAEMTGIEANAEAMARTKGADWDDKRTRNSWVKTRLVAFWKQYLAGDRKYRDALRREKADATEARFRAEQKARPIKDDGTEAAVQRFLGVG